MKYLLDTCIISYFVKGSANVRERLLSCRPADIAVSSITKMEIEYGLRLDPARERKLGKPLGDLLASVTVLPFSAEDATVAARIRARLKVEGRPVGPYDLLLAASAVSRHLVLVTANTREFAHIEGLRLECW